MLMTGVFQGAYNVVSKGLYAVFVLGIVMLVVSMVVGLYQGIKKSSWSVLRSGVASSIIILDCGALGIYVCNIGQTYSVGVIDYIFFGGILASLFCMGCLLKGMEVEEE